MFTYTNKVIASILCLLLIIGLAGCKKIDNTYSSAYSDIHHSSTPTTNVSSLISESNNKPTPSPAPNNSDNTTATNSQENISFEKAFGFNTLDSVEYKCLKDLPNGDAQYEVEKVKTDKGYALIYMIDISCKDSLIKIDNLVITIPYEYRKNHKSVTLSAKHRLAGVSCDFTITFDTWNLVFEDNFDGTELNTDVWNIWDQKRDWRYSYTKDNMFLDGKGNLVNRMSIVEDPTADEGFCRYSGAITTQDKYETTYGYFEVRLKPHLAAGLMGAFWLMAGDMGDENAANDGTAVNGCEVDIIETFYHNLNPSQTIHWDGYKHTKTKSFHKANYSEIFDGNYHTFGFLWTPEEYVFFIDGEVNARTDYMGICNQPGYLLVSSHFNSQAGEFPYGVGEYTDMLVDYVRVYKNDKLT